MTTWSEPNGLKLYLSDIKNIPLLTAEEEKTLGLKARQGSKAAAKRLINSNLRLVINIAKRYRNLGVPISDLVEEGNLGLIRALNKYDPRKGYRFSTYGTWWIRQYIMKALVNQGMTVRVPMYVAETLFRYRKLIREFTQEFGKPPTLKEISRRMKIPLKKVEDLNELLVKSRSLNESVDKNGKVELIDLISLEPHDDHFQELSDFLWQEKLNQLLGKVTSREKEVMRLRFGLDDGITRSLGEVAEQLKITRERVRQIEHSALRKLRHLLISQREESSEEKTPLSPGGT